jgi:hypothetical protein
MSGGLSRSPAVRGVIAIHARGYERSAEVICVNRVTLHQNIWLTNRMQSKPTTEITVSSTDQVLNVSAVLVPI